MQMTTFLYRFHIWFQSLFTYSSQALPDSRSVFVRLTPTVNNHLTRPRRKQVATSGILSTCYEQDGDAKSRQVVLRSISALHTARSLLGSGIEVTFLRWRFEEDIIFIAIGLATRLIPDQDIQRLPLCEDAPRGDPHSRHLPSVWCREGLYPTIVENACRTGLIAHQWGPRRILGLTMTMLKEW
jgi:hypothetical protein